MVLDWMNCMIEGWFVMLFLWFDICMVSFFLVWFWVFEW